MAVRPKNGLDAFERALEAGAFAIELVDHDGARQLEFFGEAPHFFGLHLDAGHAVHQDQSRVGRDHGDALVSLMNMLKPGVSIRLIFFLFHSAAATAVEMVILRRSSSSSKSVMVVPSSTRVRRLVAPLANKSPAAKDVLPELP